MKKITFFTLLMIFSVPIAFGQSSKSSPVRQINEPVINVVNSLNQKNVEAGVRAPVTITQNTSQSLTNALGCNDGISVYDTSIYRAFDLAADHGIVNDFIVTDVEFGVFFFNGTGPKTVTVNVYSTPGPFPGGALTLQGSSNRVVTSTDNLTVLSQPVNAIIPAGELLVYELFVGGPDGANYLGFLGNTAGQTAPTYWRSSPCGAPSIVDFGGTFAAIMNVVGEEAVGNPPIIECPSDLMVDTDPGECSAIVNFTNALAIDTEDGPLTTTQTGGPASGSMFPTGDTVVEFSVTDSDGNTVACDFTVTVTDMEAPEAICQDLTLEVDPVSGSVSITPADIDNGSSDNCGIVDYSLDMSTFTCSNTGDNDVTLTVTDAEGNSSSCTATVTIEDNTAPDIVCIGQPGTVTGSSSASPGLPIDVSNTVVTSTITIADDFEITDLNVDLDITHTWVGDLIIELQSPNGTSVILMDQPGAPATTFGCSGDDILATLDDEATDPVEDECENLPAIGGSFTPNNPLSAFDGESTMGDWTLTITDTFGGADDGTFNSWGLTYDYEVAAAPYEVDLDADGNATISADELIQTANEACGYTVTVGGPATGGGSTTETLETTFAGGNGLDGAMFDINAINEVTINSFDVNLDTGITDDIEVYYKSGTWQGFEEDAAAWTLLGTANVTSAGDGLPTPLNLNLGQTIAAGETGAFYVTTTSGGMNYTDGTATGNVFASDANIEFLEGAGKSYPFGGSTFSPRVFNGNIIYDVGPVVDNSISFDCSNLGENQIEVFVTDDSGNYSSCIATVNVNDVTAPVIICGPNPVISETVTGNPGVAIPDNSTTGVSTSITVTEDIALEDLNVDLDISHTWVGDLIVTITSPAGTSAVIVDRPGFAGSGFGCSGDNILATLDDEATDPVEDECEDLPAIGGSFTPNNPLSVFNGESTMGEWTITVSDNAGGDTGTLNSWGITYSYANPNTDVFIELGPDGTATIDPYDIISDMTEACGISTVASDITEVSCEDIGTPMTITVFASDASGNIASCSAIINVVDNIAPEVTCPADQTVDPGEGNLFYLVPDYFATGEGSALDNCTNPVTITSQDPAPGELIPDGEYTVTLTAEDEYGNVGECTFQLTVESVLGVNDNELSTAIAMYPNPADNQVTISNRSKIALQNAVIYDINGKLINQYDLRNMQGEQVIDVSALASGVYVVQITSDKSSVTKRLIIK